jgi:hypothetical protein
VTRATIILQQADRDADSGYVEEWCHEQDLELGELGVTIRWDRSYRSFIPWASIIRVDFAPCSCADCKRAA